MLPEKPRGKRAAYGLPVDLAAFLKTAQDVQTILADGVNQDGTLKSKTIRALLKFKGVDLKPLAELSGYHDTYFHQVIDRIRKDARVEDVIAQAIGMEPNRVWGRKSEEVA
jgi:lambda repressor-like predicted transcriptional regulator